MSNEDLPPLPLPSGISERYIDCTMSVGLDFHILEAGQTSESEPLVVLLHGYPELAYSWRHVMTQIASAGFHVVAPDQRGYGRTTGWDTRPYADVDLSTFRMTSLVSDILALISALGYKWAHVVGHDFGGLSASMCALMRSDVFRSCVIMSHPFKGPPKLPFNTANEGPPPKATDDIHVSLAQLDPPRKHYKWDNSEKHAAEQWLHPAQGMRDFFRGYFHLKGAVYHQNNIYPLKAWTATEVAKMPHYYIMPLYMSMPEAIDYDMKGEDANATKSWLPDSELDVYVSEWTRTGFQGGLNWYRAVTSPIVMKDLLVFSGKKIEGPTMFLSGERDWGNHQEPGAVEALPYMCADFRGIKLVPRAGHWPQQENSEFVAKELVQWLEQFKDWR